MNVPDAQILDEKSKWSWNESYRVTRNEVLWSEEAVPFVSTAVEIFLADSAQVVLDLPCGDGRNTVPLVQHLPFVLGGDSSVNALALAAKRLANCRPSHYFLMEMDLFRTHILDEQVNGVFCWDVLGHLRRPLEAITELLRICAPGGCLVGSLFSLGDSTRAGDMRQIGQEEYLYAGQFFYKFYGRTEVEELLTKSGARLEHLELSTWREPPHEGFREYWHEHQSWGFALRKI